MDCEVLVYVVKPGKNPDKIDGNIPFPVNDRILFFGPGDANLRKYMRDRFLTHTDDYRLQTDVYMMGVSEVSKENVRKVLWLGKVTRVMTFEIAASLLKKPEFKSLDFVPHPRKPEVNVSPLHVDPVVVVGNLMGYKRRTDLHPKVNKDGMPDFAKDIIHPADKGYFSFLEDEFIFDGVTDRRMALKRDCCFLCETIFYADGKGMEITDELAAIFSEKQPGQGVDKVGLFGYSQSRDGSRKMNDVKGPHLHFKFKHAEKLMNYLFRVIK
ncbi:MAG TPA: hypothetical protein VGB30_08460 [bacterium]|jgi:hypothetical protein